MDTLYANLFNKSCANGAYWCGLAGSGPDPIHAAVQANPALRSLFGGHEEYTVQWILSSAEAACLTLAILVPLATVLPLWLCICLNKKCCAECSLATCFVSQIFVSLLSLVFLALSMPNSMVLQPAINGLQTDPAQSFDTIMPLLSKFGVDVAQQLQVPLKSMKSNGVTAEFDPPFVNFDFSKGSSEILKD